METLLTVEEAAKLLGVGHRWIRNRTSKRANPRLTFFRLGGQLKFKVRDLEDYIAIHRCGPSKNEWTEARMKRGTKKNATAKPISAT
jgi:excisionase family DNA binding protein